MFSPCLHGFSPGTLAPSEQFKDIIKLSGDSKLLICVNVRVNVCLYIDPVTDWTKLFLLFKHF